MNKNDLNKLSAAGLLVALGIVFGDIGTSPLYVMNAIIDSPDFDQTLILGALSCIFWTLTLQTTIKYVIITLRADNKGEGGIFALYALLRKKRKWVYILAILGASMLFADGIITPAITVTSAIEGLKIINPGISVVPIVIIILFILFLFQQFGTDLIGKTFGPIMVIWFGMLFVLGFIHLIQFPVVLKALNPYFVYVFLHDHPNGFVLLGAVFLCTTGAEALYSDLGHCGFKNIRVSWIFVKICLIVNYLGQGAWIIKNSDSISKTLNPFFSIVPDWFILPSVIIATMAAVIASQALISGTFTLISEAIPLNFWPKLRISHPTIIKGQIYIPVINWFLFISCCGVVFYFGNSSNMEAAYGLAITITMIATTLLLAQHLKLNKHRSDIVVVVFVLFYLTIEISFLIANLYKFTHGGWITLLISGLFMMIMYTWYQVREIKKNYFKYLKINDYLDIIKDISKDKSISKFATNLVYLTRTDSKEDIESKIIYSIIYKSPKRADKYWFIHVNNTDEPSMLQYDVKELIPGILFRIDLNIGFKIRPRINLFFRKIIENMVHKKEINLTSGYDSLKKHNIPGDYKFIMIDRIHSSDLEVKYWNRLLFSFYQVVNKISISDMQAFGLDTSNVIEEKVPLHVNTNTDVKIKRI
ncbi:MAG: KUP/HAK/KT family potassium transporter [Saprospiraceae bacterium]|nr:KUP/HAK/KT family potassium transporter [Saprospiraceae bacterium]